MKEDERGCQIKKGKVKCPRVPTWPLIQVSTSTSVRASCGNNMGVRALVVHLSVSSHRTLPLKEQTCCKWSAGINNPLTCHSVKYFCPCDQILAGGDGSASFTRPTLGPSRSVSHTWIVDFFLMKLKQRWDFLKAATAPRRARNRCQVVLFF